MFIGQSHENWKMSFGPCFISRMSNISKVGGETKGEIAYHAPFSSGFTFYNFSKHKNGSLSVHAIKS